MLVKPDLEQSRIYIESMDFSMLFLKLTQPDPNIAILWSNDALEMAIRYYKNFLWINRKYYQSYDHIPPSSEIDEIWHHHILDTEKYFKDCYNIFGHYFHHYPYFGMRGPEDNKKMHDSFKITQDLHFKEFGSYIMGFDSAEEGQV
ncbi:MAG: glycine-rich domain-containing protein-like [Delftia acidovorans]|nr:glycine-rich domain-containing protein-like [Delftia acidovorans]